MDCARGIIEREIEDKDVMRGDLKDPVSTEATLLNNVFWRLRPSRCSP